MSVQNIIWHSEGSQTLENNGNVIWTPDGSFYLGQQTEQGERITQNVYYDVSRDALVVRELLQNQSTTAILPNGILWLKGTLQIDGSLTKEFQFTPAGNLKVRSLIEE